jgi:hypothetical protein
LTVPKWQFRGRDAELALARTELERVVDGAESVIVVVGAAGMGKSRLLAEVAAIARSLGIKVGASAADPSETAVELAALLAALFDGPDPLLDPRRPFDASCPIRATFLAAARPAAAPGTRGTQVATPDRAWPPISQR